VALAEINPKTADEYESLINRMVTYGFRALRTTGGIKENWIVPLLITHEQFYSMRTPRLAFKSRSLGGNQPLEWDDYYTDRDTRVFEGFSFDFMEFATRPRIEPAAQ
jgi:hypothetical protein